MLYLILVSNTEYTEIAVVLNLAFLLIIVCWNCFAPFLLLVGMIQIGHVACVGELRNAYRIWTVKHEDKRDL